MKFILNCSIFILLIIPIEAQDRNYWDQVVGSRSALLGGLVIGGVRDYSAAIYNPGALGFLDKNNLNFSFSAYGIKNFKFENGSGLKPDPSYTRISLYPSSMAGSIPFIGDSLNKFSYFLYGNYYSYVRTSARYEGYLDAIETRPSQFNLNNNIFIGDEFIINQGIYHSLLQEISFGLAYGRRISDNISVGVSLIGAYRDQTKLRNESFYALDTLSNKIASSSAYIDLDFYSVRLLGKFGIAAEFDELKFGATITLPSIHILSGATNGISFTTSNLLYSVDTLSGSVNEFDILGSDRQEGISAKYRSTFTTGFGVEYKLYETTTLNFSAEWFAPLKPYVVIQPESDNFFRNFPPEISSFNSNVFLRVYDSFSGIFNYGFAIEHEISKILKGYAAFRTDFSNASFEDINGFYLGFTDIDIYHLTVGTSIILNKTFLGLGLEYSFGSNSEFDRIFDFPGGSNSFEKYFSKKYNNYSEAIYKNLNVFFGITYLLNE